MAALTSAIVGMAATAATTGMSFAQAAKQTKLQREAEADAAKAMAEARKALDVNFYENLAIQKEPYQLEREALLSAGAQATQAGIESERGAAATAGRIQMAQQEGQRRIASAMGQELLGLEKLTAQEESRLRDMGVGLDLKEIEGAQLAAKNAEVLSNQAMQQGFQGVGQLAGQVAAALPLYAKTPSARLANDITGIATKQYGLNQTDMQKSVASLGNVNNVDLSKVSSMNPTQFNDFMSGLDVNTLNQIKQAFPNVASSFNPNPLPTFNISSTPWQIPSIGG